MPIVTVEKNTYKVEPLYQWDVDQVLEVRGLSLPSVPEIHFATVAMDRAIVRQATMDAAGVVRAYVPNSLLQKPYKILAFICTYTGTTFETQYKIEIPVVSRPQPSDYTLEADDEVYSFRAVENMATTALEKASATEQAFNAATLASFPGDAEHRTVTDAQIAAWSAGNEAPTLTVDSEPAPGSVNPVASGGVYDALAAKLDAAGGTVGGALNMGGNAVINLPTPTADSDAATKAYVDEAVAAADDAVLYSGSYTAGEAIPVPLAEGEMAQVVLRVPTGNGNVTVKVNGASPTTSSYVYATDGENNHAGNIVTFQGSGHVATFVGTLALYDGVLELSGFGRRGNNGLAGWGVNAWDGVTALESITFDKAGTLLVKKI